MKRKKLQLFAVSVALIALMLMNQSGIIHAIPLAPKSILTDTLIGSDPFLEGLELIGAEDDSLIAQYYQLGGQKTFPLDPSNTEFNNLDVLYIVSSNQENWHDYWPRSIWEFRDGATVVFQFSQGLEDSLEDATAIIPAISTWMGTTLDVLMGVYDEINDKTLIFYWGYMSPENHSDFIFNELYDVFSVGGYTNFITNEIISTAPVSVVGTGIVKQDSSWIPLVVAGFVLDEAISTDGDMYNMSINSAFGYSGSVRAAPNSAISTVKFLLPYVATVYDSFPDTDNLYPELTGSFNWTLKVEGWFDRSYEDIYVTYSKASEEINTFPQITSEVDVDIDSLHSPTSPMLNYTIDITNTGNDIAYDTIFAWDLGTGRPESVEIPLFESETYMYNTSIWKYYDIRDGLLYDTYQGFGAEIIIKGWFTYHNGTLLPTENTPIENTSYYMLDLGKVFQTVYTNKSFFSFDYSNNLAETTLENGNFALYGYIAELESGINETFWWSVGDLPGEDDEFYAYSYTVENTTTEYNITIFENTSVYDLVGNNLADYVVQEALAKGEDLRYPSLISKPDFLPGAMFKYSDSAGRDFFGWSNGLIIQLYDDEAILKTKVSLNSTIFEMYEHAEINVTIENIGDAPATNVTVQGFHAQLGPNWELLDLKAFSEEEPIGTINPGESITHTFIREVTTFIGIHPVGVVIDYTTEESEGLDGVFNSTEISDLASNLIVALVMPKSDEGDPETEYPTPVVNVSVSWTDENGDNISNGDIIEIRTEVKNLGDEATTIKLYSYFPTRMASIIASEPYDGENFKVTDVSGNVLTDYAEGYAVDHWEWPISIAAVAGIHLAPGASIMFYYKINVTNAESLILPPVAVEYDSRYPMPGASGIEGSTESNGSSSLISTSDLNLEVSDGLPARFRIQEGSSGSSWTSYSSASLLVAFSAYIPTSTTPTGGASGFTTLTSFIHENLELMIVVLAIPVVVLIVRDRRRKI
jgi:hypothetical protein